MFNAFATRYLLLISTGAIFLQSVVGTGIRNEAADTKEHALVFATKQLNLEVVYSRLMLVSDSQSVENGRFWTQEELAKLTANTDGNMIIKKYFQQNGVKIMHETLHGEYLVAMASTTIWERLLKAKLYEYNHASKYMQPTRFNNFTLDTSISRYVSAVFRVYRAPQYNPPARKSVFRKLLSSSLNIETNERKICSSFVSLWRNHDCAIEDDKDAK